MLNLNSIILFSETPSLLVEFYKKVLQKEIEWSGGEFVGFKVGGGFLVIGPHEKVRGKNTNPERIIFNLETDDVKSEYERLVSSGVKSVQAPYQPTEDSQMWIATLEDTDGNYFQLASPVEI